MIIKKAFTDLISLLFPDNCYGCGQAVVRGEKLICSMCLFDLPYTDYHLFDENRVAKQLWGRLELNGAFSMLYFKKAGIVQHLIHNLKYRQKTEIGVMLGELIGTRMLLNEKYRNIDIIMPVPLHKKRLKSRGYNQSYYIGEGAAKVMGSTLSDKNLVRNRATESQTKKARYTRYENMQSVFSVNNPAEITGKHILLVDDVLTTGATIEACGNELLKNGARSISIATIAFSD